MSVLIVSYLLSCPAYENMYFLLYNSDETYCIFPVLFATNSPLNKPQILCFTQYTEAAVLLQIHYQKKKKILKEKGGSYTNVWYESLTYICGEYSLLCQDKCLTCYDNELFWFMSMFYYSPFEMTNLS